MTIMKVGLLNICGLRGKLEELEDWMEAENLQMLALIETKLPHDMRLFTHHDTVCVRHPPIFNNTNAQSPCGGITIMLRNINKYKLAFRYAKPHFEAVGIIIKDTTYVAVYFRPQIRKEDMLIHLNMLHNRCRGKTVIFGDFNSRHRDWCSQTNQSGRHLHAWHLKNGWQLHAPPFPTRVSPGPSQTSTYSTIDLFLTRNINLTNFRYPRSHAFGISDHLPIQADLDTDYIQPPPPLRIAKYRRKRPDLLEKYELNLDANKARLGLLFDNAKTEQDLNAAYADHMKVQTEPFLPKGKYRPRSRDKPWWTPELAAGVKERNRLYKRWKRYDTINDKHVYDTHAADLKQRIRAARRKFYRDFMLELQEDSSHQLISKASKMARNRKKRENMFTTTMESELKREEFTEYVSTKFPPSIQIRPAKFTVPDTFKLDLIEAILQLASNKAAGADAIFNEALQQDVPANADLIHKIWTACGRIGATPAIWNHILLFPIYKEGMRELAQNYRAIALMSHIRKVIERAIDASVRRETYFRLSQCGFKKRSGTENAILRFIYASQLKGHNSIAVLDIKGAFPSVPRHRLMKKLRERLNANTCDMLTHMLSPDIIETLGDPNHVQRPLTTGVPEGGAISPTLFNIYIDSLIQRLERAPNVDTCLACIVYADDIMLLARFPHALQRLLNICTDWARENKMQFAPTKSFVLTKQKPNFTFRLDQTPLTIVEKAKYLGTIITYDGVHPETIVRRYAKMQAQSGRLKKLGFNSHMHPLAARKLFTSMLLPIGDYGLHLVSSKKHFRRPYQSAIRKYAAAEFYALRPPTTFKTDAARKRVFNVYGLYTCRMRRKILANQAMLRLQDAKDFYRTNGQPAEEEMKEKEMAALRHLHDRPTFIEPRKRINQARKRSESKYLRRICCEKQDPHPAMLIKSTPLSRAMVRYHSARFLTMRDKAEMVEAYGHAQSMSIRNEIRYLMQQPKLSTVQKALLLQRIETVTDLWEFDIHQPHEEPWRKFKFNEAEEIRPPMSLTEATTP